MCCLLIIVNMSSCIDDNNYCGGKQDVTEAVKIRLYPTDEQKKIINQNIGNRGFIWNKLLVKIKYGNVKPTQKNLNNILKELKNEYPFLEKSESSSRQQCDEIEPIICYTSLYYKWSVLVQLIN